MVVDLTPSAEWIWGAFTLGVTAMLWQAGDRRYVRRKPYHDAINTLTANTAATQVSVQKLETAVAVLTASVSTMAAAIQTTTSHNSQMAENLGKIQCDLSAIKAVWKGAWALKHGAYPEDGE